MVNNSAGKQLLIFRHYDFGLVRPPGLGHEGRFAVKRGALVVEGGGVYELIGGEATGPGCGTVKGAGGRDLSHEGGDGERGGGV